MVHPNEEGRIEAISYLHAPSPEAQGFALGTCIMKKADLLEFLDEADNNDFTNMNRELIQKNLSNRRIFAYHHPGYARIIRTVEDYFSASMDMLKPELKMQLFPAERPVYTKVKDSVPTLYDFNASVENSLIADGCIVRGTVRNSVLFRGVTVEEGAVVENSVIMQKTTVEKNARVVHTITDKNVVISEGAEMQGTPALPFVVGKGKKL